VLPHREQEVTARNLFIAPTTVRTHVQRVRAKYAAVGRPGNHEGRPGRPRASGRHHQCRHLGRHPTGYRVRSQRVPVRSAGR
jgi:hypothetical protein